MKSLIRFSLLFCLALLPTASLWAQAEEGIRLFEAGDHEAAASQFEALLLEEAHDATAHYYLGRIAFANEDWEKATEHLEQAVEQEEQNSVFHTWLARALLEQLQRANTFKQAFLSGQVRNHLQEAITLDPENVEARLYLGSYYLNAPAIGGGSKKKAKEQAQAIIQRDPRTGHLFMAEIYSREKNEEQTLQALQIALALDPSDPEVRYQLAMAYQQWKRYTEAFASFEHLIDADPQGEDAYTRAAVYQYGRTAVFAKANLDQGIMMLNTYVEHYARGDDPLHPGAYWRMGMLYELKGEPTKAKAAYERALAINPDYEEAQKARAALN